MSEEKLEEQPKFQHDCEHECRFLGRYGGHDLLVPPGRPSDAGGPFRR